MDLDILQLSFVGMCVSNDLKVKFYFFSRGKGKKKEPVLIPIGLDRWLAPLHPSAVSIHTVAIYVMYLNKEITGCKIHGVLVSSLNFVNIQGR